MITWDGAEASMQWRRKIAALHLPKLPVSVGILSPLPTDTGTAAGDPPYPTRATGSHHKQQEQR